MKAAMAVLGIMVLPVSLGACSSETATPAATTTTAAGAAVNSGANVVITELQFTPADVTVKANQTVTWANKGFSGHTVTATEGQAVNFKSQTFKSADAPFVFVFSQPGTYTYFCSIHGKEKMSGTVTVTAA